MCHITGKGDRQLQTLRTVVQNILDEPMEATKKRQFETAASSADSSTAQE